MGTDVRQLRPEDGLVARQDGGLRWYRCLRCDSWLPLAPPSSPSREQMPARQDIRLPLRGKPLRDKVVLRLIAIDRAFHFVILSALAVAVFGALLANRAMFVHGMQVSLLLAAAVALAAVAASLLLKPAHTGHELAAESA